MRKQSFEFLRDLMNAPTPSSFEAAGQRVWCNYVRKFADKVTTDRYGNAIAVLNPKGSPVIMLDGHVDEIGLMVKHIDDKGFIRFQAIGFIHSGMLLALRVTIHTAKGPVLGVIGTKPPHQMNDEDKKAQPAIHDLWIGGMVGCLQNPRSTGINRPMQECICMVAPKFTPTASTLRNGFLKWRRVRRTLNHQLLHAVAVSQFERQQLSLSCRQAGHYSCVGACLDGIARLNVDFFEIAVKWGWDYLPLRSL